MQARRRERLLTISGIGWPGDDQRRDLAKTLSLQHTHIKLQQFVTLEHILCIFEDFNQEDAKSKRHEPTMYLSERHFRLPQPRQLDLKYSETATFAILAPSQDIAPTW